MDSGKVLLSLLGGVAVGACVAIGQLGASLGATGGGALVGRAGLCCPGHADSVAIAFRLGREAVAHDVFARGGKTICQRRSGIRR